MPRQREQPKSLEHKGVVYHGTLSWFSQKHSKLIFAFRCTRASWSDRTIRCVVLQLVTTCSCWTKLMQKHRLWENKLVCCAPLRNTPACCALKQYDVQICKIEQIVAKGKDVGMRVKWYYRPEETCSGRRVSGYIVLFLFCTWLMLYIDFCYAWIHMQQLMPIHVGALRIKIWNCKLAMCAHAGISQRTWSDGLWSCWGPSSATCKHCQQV